MGTHPTSGPTVGVLGVHSSKETKAILNAIEALGYESAWLRTENTAISVTDGEVEVEPAVDIIINRLLLSNTRYPIDGVGLARALAGVRPMLNQPGPVATALHKFATAVTLAEAGVPEDEEQRLAALAEYDVDEHEFREYLDTLTTLIAQTFDAEYATVGLVEEHEQRLLSCHGTDVDSVARGDTICTYTIMAGGVMTVEDTSTDPRFENNEILAGLDIRSYAGAPLIAPSGAVIGTVCVFDTKPRTFTEEEREQLRRFADITLDQLEMRRKATLADAQ